MVEANDEHLRIRRAGPVDATAVRALTRAAYAKWVPLIGREPTPMAADYEAAVCRHMIDLLMVETELVALIETVRVADHLLIENVAVSPPCQHLGYGRLLLAHAERLAADLGVATVRLYTNQKFASNLELYRRLGYVVDREEQFWGGCKVHMSKRVA